MKTLAMKTFLSFFLTLTLAPAAIAFIPFQTEEEQIADVMLKCSDQLDQIKQIERVYVKEAPSSGSPWRPAFNKENLKLTIRFNNNAEAQDFVEERLNNRHGVQTAQFMSQCQSQALQKMGEESSISRRYCAYLVFKFHKDLMNGKICN